MFKILNKTLAPHETVKHPQQETKFYHTVIGSVLKCENIFKIFP